MRLRGSRSSETQTSPRAFPILSRRQVLTGGAATAAGLLASAGAMPLEAATPDEPSPDVYRRIGAKPFINGTATLTINGGSRLLPEVIEAVAHASHYHVDLDQLMEVAGRRLADLLEVEWAMVSSGSAAALTHATAACVAGTDPERMQQLPDVAGLKHEVIIPRSSRNAYDHAVRTVGVTIIEVDSVDELEAVINHRTAMVMILGNRFEEVPLGLKDIAPIANAAGVPVLVDAAADYPVTPNPYLASGADLVVYSGGKILRGPQTAGLLLGREDLLRAAYANAAPHHAFGRAMKVSKEEIVGMVTAVEIWVERRNLREEYAEWEDWYRHISETITQVPGVTTEVRPPSRGGPFPTLRIEWDPSRIGLTADELHDLLLDGSPAIQTQASGDGHDFLLRPMALKPGEHETIATRLAEVFRAAPGPRRASLAPARSPVAGRWDLSVRFALGQASHVLFLEADGNHLVGTHVGSLTRGPATGVIDGDRIRLQSVLPFEGTRLRYRFEGVLRGDQMEGDLDMGEYPAATWVANRHDYGTTVPEDPVEAGKRESR